MWLGLTVVLLLCSVAIYGDHFIPRPKESDVEIPETIEELEKTFPQGSDWMRLLKAERAIAKYGALKLIFRNPREKSNEVVMEKSIFLYLPHRVDAPTTNYRVQVRDLSSGRVIAYKFLPIQSSGWHKVALDRWPDNSYRGLGFTLANHGLEIRLRQKNGGKIDFEEFYRKSENFGHKFLPTLLIYYKNDTERSLEDFLYSNTYSNLHLNPHGIDKKTVKGELRSDAPAIPRRTRRSLSSASCDLTMQNVPVNLNNLNVNPLSYYPNMTAKCTGGCTPTNSSKCDPSVHDCCVPSKKRDLTMLYISSDGILVLRTFPDMIVEKCACASSITSQPTTAQKG